MNQEEFEAWKKQCDLEHREAVRLIGSGLERDLFGMVDYRQRMQLASAGGVL